MPKYLTISSTGIRIGKKTSGLYSATSIASAEAIFLVIGKNALHIGLALSGGAVGSLLGLGLDRFGKQSPLVETGSRVVETTLEELPTEITGHADWPIKVRQGPVIVIPRDAVVSIRYSFWQWGIFVQTADVEFRIEPPFFGRKQVLSFLREVGWQL